MSTATLDAPPEETLEADALDGPPALPRSRDGEPAVEVAAFFPMQGHWTEKAYFALPDDDGPRCELVKGRLELLPMPTRWHESIADYLFERLKARLGRWNAYGGGYRLRIRANVPRRPDDFRFPDAMASLDCEGWGEKFATAATLVAEVVSGDPRDRERDFEAKRRDYAEAGVPEYWIVDPEARTVTVLALDGGSYREAGRYAAGQTAASLAVEGFVVDVDELLAEPPA